VGAPYQVRQRAPQRTRASVAHGSGSSDGILRRSLPLLAWSGSLLAGTALFHAMGSGPLSPPPLTDPSSWQAWADGRDPLTAVVAVLRLLVLALAWYLVGVTTIGALARLSRAARLRRIADALTVPAVRRLLQGALGVGLATAMVGAATPAGHRTAADDVLIARSEGGEVRIAVHDGGDEARLTAPDELGEVRMNAAEGEDGALPVPLQLLDADAPGGREDEVSMRRVVDGTSDRAASYEVVAGDSLWKIAAVTLEAAWGRPPSDAALHRYWGSLIEVNRGRLADPDNADLIFPGQSLVLPPAPAAGGTLP
jgi:hypothetical protein